MRTTHNIFQVFKCKTLFAFMVSMLFTLHLFGQDKISVIGNTKGVPSTMKMTEVISVLKGEKQRWGDGTKIVIALMKTNTPIGSNTGKKIYNMSGDELNKYWLALVFQGKTQAPTFFSSATELETFVAQTPGAIGVVETPAGAQTQTIAIDGKKTF